MRTIFAVRCGRTLVRALQAVVAATGIIVVISGCSAPKSFNTLSVGMSKSEVVRVLGQPSGTSVAEGTELLWYHLGTHEKTSTGTGSEYFVKVVNRRVASFGRLGDFDVRPRIDVTATSSPVSPTHAAETSGTEQTQREAIRQLYLTLQQREPDWQGWNYWANDSAPMDEIKQQMMTGVEYQTKQEIIQIFQTVFHRAPVAQELGAWYGKAAEDGFKVAGVKAALQQPDQGKHEAIRLLYKYLQRREPDEQGWTYWTDYDGSIPEIVSMMMSGIEYTTKQQIMRFFHQFLDRDPSVTELHTWYSLLHSAQAEAPPHN